MDFSKLYLFEKAINAIISIELNYFINPELFKAAHIQNVRTFVDLTISVVMWMFLFAQYYNSN